MLIDHIFIFCSSKKDADELVQFGLTEGSGRTHQGVGTANRRFFFDNFYLEILWVQNEDEAKLLKDIGIWNRYDYKNTGYSQFGLCMVNTDNSDEAFENAYKWQPEFLPEGQVVEIITNERMPWIFRFPKGRVSNFADEPKKHTKGIRSLTKATFNIPQLDFKEVLSDISNKSIVEFNESEDNSITLEFDNGKQGQEEHFKKFNLTLRY